jgi:iron complex transport system substrate-binding protein
MRRAFVAPVVTAAALAVGLVAGLSVTTLDPLPAAAQRAPELPVTVENADGSTTEVTDVSRIVPLNGDIAEVVFALGLGADVVATDISATHPAKAAALPKVGYQRSLNAEGILSFQPTVVIGNVDAGPPPVIQQLRDAGVPVVIFEFEPTLDAPVEKIHAIADALGVPERGDALAKKTSTAIRKSVRLAKQADDEPRAVFLYVRGAQTQMIGGAGSGADVLLEAAHATDAASEAGIQGFAPITPESLVAAAPDVIVVTTSGLESVGGIDGLLAIPGVAQTPAGQARAILAYDDQKLLGGGPRTGSALRDLVLDLHPELA